MDKKPLIILTGPTAVGKTKLSISLAKQIGGEIISADSMQIYQYMDIGSAKIKKDEMQGIPHYLVDELDPTSPFHVAAFQQMAKTALAKIYSHGNIPIVVGGTGFYIQALLYDIDFSKGDEDETYRFELEKLAEEKGNLFLHELLRQLDPKSAADIHPNNVKRVIRALEYYRQAGEPISAHNAREKEKESPYNSAYFVITDDRQVLYERINQRVDLMIQDGLVDEVKQLQSMGMTKDMVSMQGLGYKEILDYLNGAITLEDAIYLIKRDTRHFAKRQLTWFHREKNVIWLNKQQFTTMELMIDTMTDNLKERNIITC